ncbi:MAG: 3-phosphoshikimate 1-carboxyvinyltransferase [Oscillospiraceae bacterium]|nr:3-phosphoshikimate 1-carboxyvinyltransferase [Oscillospiraceae bacterium]
MKLRLYPGTLHGQVCVPPSKSVLHRTIIANALCAEKPLSMDELCDDVRMTARAMQILTRAQVPPRIDCGMSASTLRFLLPLSQVLCGGADFYADSSLLRRPLPPYGNVERKDGFLRVRGALKAGIRCMAGDVSSQFVSGLLFALPLLDGESEIRLTVPLQSEDYVNLTRDILRRFSITSEETAHGWHIGGGQSYRRCGDVPCEGDWSAAAPFFAMNALGCGIDIGGLARKSLQPDRVIEPLSKEFPAHIDVSNCIDLAPTLAALAALTPQQATVLCGTRRLRFKESDRAAAIFDALTALGGEVEATADTITIRGVRSLRGGTVDARGDHRIAMMAAVLALRAEGPVTVLDAQCVSKSYPAFWRDCARLGMRMEEVDA